MKLSHFFHCRTTTFEAGKSQETKQCKVLIHGLKWLKLLNHLVTMATAGFLATVAMTAGASVDLLLAAAGAGR